MSKHILVCLPISAEQRARIEAVQGFEYRFTTPDTATAEDALWADAVLGNMRSRHVLQKVGFYETGQDDTFAYYRCDRENGI